ncbi:HEAT repeat domain-containing protein [Fulvivirga sp. 29W222]|uniref:HEAT repeat domain-containing protein n=1 Tax=Fulvivirga marina TaxID=2494733 RepID=A0A937KFF5_9BACT|nr:HEAT repeat domain-containing protein [Fulvivirga marina]MBL6448143.1 HEAT repeat domain-containing protein [Fulvivirga marina]
MDTKDLINKYRSGQLSSDEEKMLDRCIETGEVSLEELDDLAALKNNFDAMPVPEPSQNMSDAFYANLEATKQKEQRPKAEGNWFSQLWVTQPFLRWAYSVALIIVGLGAGYWLKSGGEDSDKLENLSAEVSEMKEVMMLTLLDKESPSDRLKAVNLTSELPDASAKVTEALLQTLNQDENVNVRLATLEALYPYASHPQVREGLIKSIALQESPLVQMALAEMMVALQEKRSVQNLEKVLKKENTPPEVRERIEKSIEVLI